MLMLLLLQQVPRAVSPHLLAFFFFFQAFRFLNQRRTRGEFFLGEGDGNGKAQATILGKVVSMGKNNDSAGGACRYGRNVVVVVVVLHLLPRRRGCSSLNVALPYSCATFTHFHSFVVDDRNWKSCNPPYAHVRSTAIVRRQDQDFCCCCTSTSSHLDYYM